MLGFRRDIAGLRAWAVLAVVLFHFGVPGFLGGFVGVDIFFVISGYLMTQIILRGLESRNFSLWDFYLARARRIVPALLALCATVLLLGWFVLPAAEYQSLGKHALTSLLFVSNMQYWREAGYFDVASHDKWLLHTWSLSVEWQFYLVLPLLLWGVFRRWPGRRSAALMLIVLLLVSFALCVWSTGQKPEAAFFLLPTRAWEMLAGALAALYEGNTSHLSSRRQRGLEFLGFATLALSLITANPAHWPGATALLPVFGTVLVLLARRQSSPWTAPSLFQRLGDWSYSIYLWHWPVAAALVYVGWQKEVGAIFVGFGLSLFLGWLSFCWVEPLGRKLLVAWRGLPALGVFGLGAFLVVLSALGIYQLRGVPGRLNPEMEEIAAAANNYNPLREKSHTTGGTVFKKHVYGGGDIRAIVWGDSHASTIVTAVQAALKKTEDGVLGMSYTSCPSLFGVRQLRQDLHCAEFNEWALLQMAELPAHVPVIIVNRGSAYLHGIQYGASEVNPMIYFDSSLHKLEVGYNPFVKEYSDQLVASVCKVAKIRPVYLVRPFPEMPVDVPRAMARAVQLSRPLEAIHMPIAVYRQRNAAVLAAQDRAANECGVHLLDPLPLLCRGDRCMGMDGKIPRYYDDNHLSESGNRQLVEIFRLVLSQKI